MSAPASRGAAVEFRHVNQTFVSGQRAVDALVDVDISIRPGEFVGLVGPSGCGKTTLLNMVAGLVRPTEGEVLFDGDPVRGPSEHVAYMFARDALLPWRTALQNVELGLQVRRVPRSERRAVATDWLERVHLGGFESARVAELSQGMRQRVAIARTLALSPRCVLMDEPFAALDAQTRVHVQEEFVSLWERAGVTVLLVTHDLREAVSLCDRVVQISLRPGRVKADVTVELERPRDLESVQAHPTFVETYGRLAASLHEDVVASEPGYREGVAR